MFSGNLNFFSFVDCGVVVLLLIGVVVLLLIFRKTIPGKGILSHACG